MAESPDPEDKMIRRIRAFRIEFFLWLIGFVGVAICVQDSILDPPPDLRTMLIGGFFAGYIPVTLVAEALSKWK